MGFTTSDWNELTSEAQEATYSAEDATGRMSIMVSRDQYEDALQFILPLTNMVRIDVGPPPTFKLTRNIPAKWPFGSTYDMDLWAYSVKATGVGSVERVVSPVDGVTEIQGGSIKVPTGTSAPLNWSRNIDLDGSIGAATINQTQLMGGYFRYEKYLLTIDFKPIVYPMFSDDVIVPYQTTTQGPNSCIKFKEWERWVTWTYEPYAELLQLSGSRLQFVENALSPDPVTGIVRPPTIGRTFPVPLGLIEQKGIVTAYWHNVPADFLLGTCNKASNILKCIGTVNSVPFPRDIGDDRFKYLPGVLLLSDTPQMIVKPIGLRRRGPGFAYPWQYDVIIKWRHFDPPMGTPVPPRDSNNVGIGDRPPMPPLPAGEVEPVARRPRGHLLFPPAGQNYYIYANRLPFEVNIPAINPPVNNINNPPLYKQTDHGDIFQFNRGD